MADPSASPASRNSAAVPDELQPRGRGRPPGSKNKPKEGAGAELTRDMVASAWAGLWLVLTFVTWALAGRVSAPVARWSGATWRLLELEPDEKSEDAKSLIEWMRQLPTPVITVLRWLGAPVLMADRVKKKLQKTPIPKPPDTKPKVDAVSPPRELASEPGLG